jgi:hypothetical protein
MADAMGQRQLRNQGPQAEMADEDRESDDLKFSRAETARLQREAQDRINAKRNPGIGVAP